jgi:outer membrane protein insertion porin family/translocation and assembly module TamA
VRGGLFIALFVVVSALAGCKEEGSIKVHSLTFKGVNRVKESALREALATHANSKLPWGTHRYFERKQFDADLARLKAFYTDRGFPRARVTGFDVRLNQKQDAVDLIVTVDEGPPLVLAAVTFTGFDVIPADHLADMKTQLRLPLGEPRDRQAVVAAHQVVLNELRDHGFPYASVRIDEQSADQRDAVSVTFGAEPGKAARFGPVEIAGQEDVSEDVIRRRIGYAPGDVYRRSLVQRTQQRLFDTQLFQFVNVEALKADSQPDEVPTKVTVVEGPDYRVRFGAGYGTEEKVRAQADYHRLNFLGGARTAGVNAKWSSLDRGIKADMTQPYVWRPEFSLAGELQQWFTYTPAYRADTTGARLTLRHRSDRQNTWSVSLTSEHDRNSIAPEVLLDPKLRNDLIALGLDPETGEQSGYLTSAGFEFHRSTADSALNARRGYQVTLHAELAGGWLPGTFNYQSVSGDFRDYVPLGDRLVVATRLQFGNIRPSGGNPANVPFSKKYFLGGATSIRGWGVYEVSPLSSTGLPIGGNSMFAATAEARIVVRGKLGAVAFLDTGNVWADANAIALDDLRYAVGAGLRYQTPIGPARFDYGYQLNPIPGLVVNGEPQSRRWRVHFSIGQAF